MGSCFLYPELFAVMLGNDNVVIVGRVTLNKPELNLESRLFQLAGARRAMSATGIQNLKYLSSR